MGRSLPAPAVAQRLRGLASRARRLAPRAFECGLLVVALALTRVLTIYLWRLPNGDVTLYHAYALAFWTRQPLFHALPVEYPPLALLPFSLTLVPPISDFLALYAYWMGALVVAGYLAFRRWSTQGRALAYAVYLVVGAAGTLLARFDIVPALVTLAALWATERRRFDAAYLLIAAGTLLKLYPLFLLPIVLIAQAQAETAQAHAAGWRGEALPAVWRRIRSGDAHSASSLPAELWALLRAHPATKPVVRGAALALGVVALGFAMALALDPRGALSSFTYAGARPLEVESVPATLLWLGSLVGIPAQPVFSFASLNYVGPLDALLRPLAVVALPLVCGVVYLRQMRGRLSAGQAFVACLCAVIVTNKVFSPQYLIWVLPLVAAVEGFDWWWLAVCAATTLVYPTLYQLSPTLVAAPKLPLFMPALALRNLLLVALTVRAVLRPSGSAGEASRTRTGSERELRGRELRGRELRRAAHRVTHSGGAGSGDTLPNERQCRAAATTAMRHAGRDGAEPAVPGQG